MPNCVSPNGNGYRRRRRSRRRNALPSSSAARTPQRQSQQAVKCLKANANRRQEPRLGSASASKVEATCCTRRRHRLWWRLSLYSSQRSYRSPESPSYAKMEIGPKLLLLLPLTLPSPWRWLANRRSMNISSVGSRGANRG